MKLIFQVITVDLSILLKKVFGITQQSQFYWVLDLTKDYKKSIYPEGYFSKEDSHIEYYAAFTVAELAVMLGEHVNDIRYTNGMWSDTIHGKLHTRQVQCYYEYLVFCIEDGRLTTAEANQRLNKANSLGTAKTLTLHHSLQLLGNP